MSSLLGLACFSSIGLGIAAAATLAFSLFEQSGEGYSMTVYGVLTALVACELFASLAMAIRRTLVGGGLFVLLALPLAIYESLTAVAGVGITYFISVAALIAGIISLLLRAMMVRFSRAPHEH